MERVVMKMNEQICANYFKIGTKKLVKKKMDD